MFTLDQILGLVGTLDDSPGENTPRERFRHFLQTSVDSIGAVRDYVEECTKSKGPQYDHALQDLVNHAGALIGFDAEFGRYKGVPNEIGHDGLWRWNDFAIVIEVKTTDAFSIHTATLVGYVDRLISKGAVPDWDHAMGLYVFGRTDSQLKQLANSIVAEKRTHQLRIATVDDVLSVAELVQDGYITADEAVALFRPAGVFVADTVRLLARTAAKPIDLTASSFEAITEEGEARPPPPVVQLVPEALSASVLTLTRPVETEPLHLIPIHRDYGMMRRGEGIGGGGPAMRTNYPVVIDEELATLQAVERQLRGRPTAVRAQALRLLKSGVARSLRACATLVGHSPRQVARWWATYRAEGLAALLREPTYPGKTSRLTPEALAGLEAAMSAGQIATLKDAQAYLAERQGIVYGSLNGVWAQLRKHRIKLKTGRRRHEYADAAAQEAFTAGFRGNAGREWGHAGVGL